MQTYIVTRITRTSKCQMLDSYTMFDQAGDYRCQMGGKNFYFTILWRGRTVLAL